METKEKTNSFAAKLGKVLLRILSFVLTFVVAVALTLIISLKMFCSDDFPHVQQTFVTTVLETGQLKFLASLFLSPEEIQKIVDENSMKEFDVEVDTGLIQMGGFGNAGLESGNAQDNGKDIEIFEVAGNTYTGIMMIVKDPSRVSLASIYPWRETGVTLDVLVNSNNAVAGINGGLYNSKNNSGGHPYGVLVSNGEIQYNKPQEYTGLVLVGFTEDHILQIIDISKMTPNDIVTLVKEKKIRDAVTFQEEASDANNHFVQLIINNEVRQLNGMGSGLNPRTAIGQRADGAVLMFVTDGRGKAGHLGASCADLIAVMEAVNVKDGLVKLLKKEHITHGIEVIVGENNEITIDFHVIIAYGVGIVTVCDNLIETVKYKVEQFTGMKVDKINIHVEGVRVID